VGSASPWRPIRHLALIAPLWEWIDQKNEAIGLLQKIRAGLSGRLDGTVGRERARLTHVAHTLIVVSGWVEPRRMNMALSAG
jgi:hypothetical protein